MELSSSGAPPRLRVWRNIPWPLVFVTLAIASLGVWNLASASRAAGRPIWEYQIYWLLIGSGACLVVMFFDYRHLLRLAYPIYVVLILMLIAVLFVGRAKMGATRWLSIGPMSLQPSELMKIAVVVVLARFFHEDVPRKQGYGLRDLWQPALLVLAPVALTMKQPDLGTAMMISAIAGTVILFAKVRWQALVVVGVAFAITAVLAWGYVLKDYQKKRVHTFINPEGDVLGAGYHASQSLIAVGSGQGTGKGWKQGTQTELSFLPEQHTDFIFSVWGEEQGFLGAVVLISLYLTLLLLALGVAAGAREKFGAYLAVGMTALLFWHVFINIGMVTGILPVVGVPLPLMSYGGSSVLTNLAGLGLLLNVGMRRHLF